VYENLPHQQSSTKLIRSASIAPDENVQANFQGSMENLRFSPDNSILNDRIVPQLPDKRQPSA
jgi:hypothetical protein